MIKITKLILLILLLFSWSTTSFANSLDEQISDLISQQLPQVQASIDDIIITYVGPKPKLNCDSPILTLLNKKKRWGNVTISAQCNNKAKKYIQVNIAIMGSYIVANQTISSGTIITEEHLRQQSGHLDTLPANVILDKAQAINHIALRDINPDEPIKAALLQKNWHVKAGQMVKVIIEGDGYQIVTSGKTLNNAILDDHINIRLNSGNILEGIVTSQGVVIFNK